MDINKIIRYAGKRFNIYERVAIRISAFELRENKGDFNIDDMADLLIKKRLPKTASDFFDICMEVTELDID